jgi:hypothetical protein
VGDGGERVEEVDLYSWKEIFKSLLPERGKRLFPLNTLAFLEGL